jgi:hypothetical protein
MTDGILGDDFRAWFDGIVPALHDMAGERIAKGGGIPPAILAFHRDGSMSVYMVPLDSIDDKNLVAALHRQLAARPDVVGAVFVSEAWTVEASSEEVEREGWRTSREGIENHPRKTEIVVWSAMNDKRQLLARAAIERPANRLGPVRVNDPARELWQGRVIREGRPQ